MNNLKINIAYNEILVYDYNDNPLYFNSNVNNYDIHPWHTGDYYRLYNFEKKYNIKFPYKLNETDSDELRNEFSRFTSQDFSELLDNNLNNFNKVLFDDIYNTSENFIYPIILFNNELFFKYNTIDLNPKLVECVKNKRAKICLYQPTEGFFGHSDNEYTWVHNLSKKYEFQKDDIIVITSNLKANDDKNQLVLEGKIIDNYTIFPYSYFQHNLWFENCKLLNNKCKDKIFNDFYYFLNLNKNIKKDFHFISFNRVTKLHRIAIFGELMTNDNFKNKYIVSMGGVQNDIDKKSFFNQIINNINPNYSKSRDKLLNFFKTYDSTQHYVYDENDLENNKASNINKKAHSISFINIVTESLIDNRSVFFSEKIYKPIVMAQPFILFGNPYSLKKLKEYGFQTFDRWWDESYDTEIDFTKKLEKIISIMEEISTWDMDKCYMITQEMQSVFQNNVNILLDTKEIKKLYNIISFKNDNKIKKLI
jgi:hypothetical protein